MSSAYFGISSSLRWAAPRSSVIELDAAVGGEEDGAAGGLVDAARLHADEAVLDEVEPADAVPAAELVEAGEEGGGGEGLAVDRDRVAALEADLDVLGRVGRLLRVDGALVDVRRRLLGGVLEHLALGGGVQEVRVDRERRLAALVPGDRDLVRLGELEEPGAGGEVPFAPRRDDADRRVERIGRELEADLVVALAGGAVGDGVGAGRLGDLDEALGDQRAGDRGAEQVEALVLGVGAEHREDEVADELVAQVLDEDVLGAHAEELGLLARRLELLALAEVGGEGDDLAAVFGLRATSG